jgi:uncharacterized protein (DUF58 family)
VTRRGRLAILLGLGVYVAAWAFGSEPLYPVAVGLLLAGALAWAWVRLLARPMDLHRTTWRSEHVEGDDIAVDLVLTHPGPVRPGAVRVVDRLARIGALEATLRRRSDGTLGGRYVIPAVPRGRYRFETSNAVVEDPFRLERADVQLTGAGALLVLPRIVELDALFSESGSHALEGRRLLLRRPTGFDLHSVREYERGESLRKVHWRSTARRGQLMVKELEDAPRDEVAVLLDASSSAVAGTPPDSSFDVQVRAAGSLLNAHARRGRRALLVVNGLDPTTQRLRDAGGEWRSALELLAAAEPTGTTPAAALLADESAAATRALDLAVVTAQLTPALVERLVQRAFSRRGVSVVYVDAPTFAAPRAESTREPLLLRLQSAGIPVTAIRRGDDLRERLSAAAPARKAAHG